MYENKELKNLDNGLKGGILISYAIGVFMGPTIQFEWMFETINKRLGAPHFCKLSELFLCVPFRDEAEFDYELLSMFKTAERKLGVTVGNALSLDYPNIAKLAAASNKVLKLKVFFVKSERLPNPVICSTRKYKYPKINLKRADAAFDLTSTDRTKAMIEHAVRENYLKKQDINVN